MKLFIIENGILYVTVSMVAMQNKGVWYCYDKLSKSFKT